MDNQHEKLRQQKQAAQAFAEAKDKPPSYGKMEYKLFGDKECKLCKGWGHTGKANRLGVYQKVCKCVRKAVAEASKISEAQKAEALASVTVEKEV